MTRTYFKMLLQMVVTSEVMRDAYNILILQMAATLWFLATGDSYSSSRVHFHKKFPNPEELHSTIDALAVVMRLPFTYAYSFITNRI
jgi:hypothetical protein